MNDGIFSKIFSDELNENENTAPVDEELEEEQEIEIEELTKGIKSKSRFNGIPPKFKYTVQDIADEKQITPQGIRKYFNENRELFKGHFYKYKSLYFDERARSLFLKVSQNNTLRDENDKLNDQVNDLKKEQEAKELIISNYKEQLSIAARKYIELQEQKQNEATEFNKKITELNNELHQTTQELADTRDQMHEQKGRAEGFKHTADTLQEELAKQKAELELKARELEEKQRELEEEKQAFKKSIFGFYKKVKK